MKNTILFSTALILGLTANNLHVVADDTVPENNKKNDIIQPNPLNSQLQQSEIKLNNNSNNEPNNQEKTTNPIDEHATDKLNNQLTQENNSQETQTNQSLQSVISTNSDVTSQGNAYKSTTNVSAARHRRHISAYQQTKIKRIKTRKTHVNLTPYRFTFCQRTIPKLSQQTNAHQVALMTMDNLLHASTNNPLAGRRHYISKHIKKLPTVY